MKNDQTSLRHLVIVGSGFTPVLAALFLQKKWGPLAPRITLLDCGENPDPPVMSCVSSLKIFHGELGLSEKDFVRKTGAAFHLGTAYRFNDGSNRPDFFLCEAPYGFNLKAVRFHHWYKKFIAAGNSEPFDHFCLNALLANSGRFVPTANNPDSVFSHVCYGYKFVTVNYARYLAEQLAPTTQIKKTAICSVNLDSDGSIKGIGLEHGDHITGDLYIDCSSERLLKGQFDQNDTTELDITPGEWEIFATPQCRLGPPHNALHIGKGRLCQETQLHGQTYRQNILVAENNPPDWLRDRQPWQKNCLALGPAVFCRPSLLIDPLHITASALYRLHSLWPTTADFHISAENYNSNAAEEWARITDSDSLHIWAACGGDARYLTDNAEHRLRIFESEGRTPPYESETMTEEQWAALFMALGVMPKVSDPLAEGTDDQWLNGELQRILTTLKQASSRAPLHEEFYRREVMD